jgi:RNA polymerase sigma factor (sigma-70 family)
MNELEVERARTGERADDDALLELCLAHGQELARRLRIPADMRSVVSIDDVLQEAYVDACLHLDLLRGASAASFRAWLGRVLFRHLCDVIRAYRADKRGGSRRRVPLNAGAAGDAGEQAEVSAARPSTELPLLELVRAEDEERLLASVRALPPAHARVVVLHDLEGWPMARVAAELGRTVGATYMLHTRALRLLRAKLNQAG